MKYNESEATFIFVTFFTAVRCPAHGSLANGVIRSTGDTMGKKLTYICNTGYGLSAEGERVCQGNGQWTGDAPTCVCKLNNLSSFVFSILLLVGLRVARKQATFIC